MKAIKHVLGCGAILLALSACTGTSDVAIREQSGGLAAGSQSANFRVAEARAHFRLGNIALAAEGFRKALREDSSSIDAMNGLAACYDRLGRFDLSRGFYERALALAPGDARLYANLATSLSLQGNQTEAAQVRAEMVERLGASQSISVALPASAPPVAAPVAAPIAVAFSPTEIVSMPLAEAAPPPAPVGPVMADRSVEAPGPRLERVGLAEVVLVTNRARRGLFAQPMPVPATVAPVRTARATTPAKPAIITILNAARVNRLAANTRVRVQRLGWREVAIGNAPQVLARSEIAFPERRRAEAERLARQLGIASRLSRASTGNRLVIILGRDRAGRQNGA